MATRDRRRGARDEALRRWATERDAREARAYEQSVAADAVNDLARQAQHDSAAGMPVSGRMLRQARDERAADLESDGSAWLPPGARPPRPQGALHPAHQKPPKVPGQRTWRWWSWSR